MYTVHRCIDVHVCAKHWNPGLSLENWESWRVCHMPHVPNEADRNKNKDHVHPHKKMFSTNGHSHANPRSLLLVTKHGTQTERKWVRDEALLKDRRYCPIRVDHSAEGHVGNGHIQLVAHGESRVFHGIAHTRGQFSSNLQPKRKQECVHSLATFKKRSETSFMWRKKPTFSAAEVRTLLNVRTDQSTTQGILNTTPTLEWAGQQRGE